MMRHGWLTVLAATACCGLAVGVSHAQDVPAAPSKQPETPGDAGESRALDWATRELERLQRREERLKVIIEKLKSGVSPEELRALIAESRGGGGRGGPGQEPMDGPPGEGPRIGEGGERGPSGSDGGFAGHRFGRGSGGDEPKREPTEEDFKAAQEFLQATAPQLHALYLELREKDPEAAKNKLREALPRIQHLLDMRRNDPEMFTLKLQDIRHGREAFDAGRKIVEFDREHPEGTSDPARQALMTSLRASLSDQYDIRGRIIEREVQQQDKDLIRRKDEWSRRADQKQSSVDKMAEDMVRRIKNWRPGKGRGVRGEGGPPPAGENAEPRRKPD